MAAQRSGKSLQEVLQIDARGSGDEEDTRPTIRSLESRYHVIDLPIRLPMKRQWLKSAIKSH
ncbi:hypothetical protein [Paraburkholderia terrae]|uniref:hypothetical protein n=1 Tax=Paraburkholderia terrae TaxID=311230 RepID=UPI0020BF8B5A|nr:hypothetical protein [Paraburkholderia terrae]